MKFSLSLLALFAFALTLTGCDSLANRRRLYAPKKGDGYWTKTLDDGTWRERGSGSDRDPLVPRPASSTETAPVVPPPPPAPLPSADPVPPAL